MLGEHLHERVDGMALYFLRIVAELVHDQGDGGLQEITQLGVGHEVSQQIERGRLLELKLSMGHVLED